MRPLIHDRRGATAVITAVASSIIAAVAALSVDLGTVGDPIVGAEAKRRTLIETAAALGIPIDAAMAVGDGANDISMLQAAGLGVAYHAKPKTAAGVGSGLAVTRRRQGHRRVPRARPSRGHGPAR